MAESLPDMLAVKALADGKRLYEEQAEVSRLKYLIDAVPEGSRLSIWFGCTGGRNRSFAMYDCVSTKITNIECGFFAVNRFDGERYGETAEKFEKVCNAHIIIVAEVRNKTTLCRLVKEAIGKDISGKVIVFGELLEEMPEGQRQDIEKEIDGAIQDILKDSGKSLGDVTDGFLPRYIIRIIDAVFKRTVIPVIEAHERKANGPAVEGASPENFPGLASTRFP